MKEIFTCFNTKPILFIGSGVSKRYLNLPDWKTLLEHFAEITAPEKEFPFNYYDFLARRKMDEEKISNQLFFPTIAELIEVEYNEKFFSSKNFESDVKNNYKNRKNQIRSPFKLAVCMYLNEVRIHTYTLKKEEELLKTLKNKVSNIITTNYDGFIENIFNNYSILIGQTNIFNQDLKSIGNIFKIHNKSIHITTHLK